ncbi:MAG: ferrochelatase [Acidobacteriota bacterium]
MSSPATGVLIMAYGSAPSMEDEAIFNYLRHILQYYRRTDPSEAEFDDLRERYRRTGESPLYRITEGITEGLQQALQQRKASAQFRTYMAMKHSPPFIEEVVEQMAEDGLQRAIAVALSPFRSRLSTEGYYRMVKEANEGLEQPLDWFFTGDWNLHPLFLELWQDRLQEALKGKEDVFVIFTNHSLPARIQEWNDPYGSEFEATAEKLAEQCSLTHWTTAYQSQGGGNQSWLGPPLEQVLRERKDQGSRDFLLAPVGFLMDHLEVLYDLDIEASSQADRLGITLARTPMPNDDPRFISMLADLVEAQYRQET